MKLFKRFAKDETGAVTVDWVVLAAGVVALTGVAVTAVSSSFSSVVSVIEDGIQPDS